MAWKNFRPSINRGMWPFRITWAEWQRNGRQGFHDSWLAWKKTMFLKHSTILRHFWPVFHRWSFQDPRESPTPYSCSEEHWAGEKLSHLERNDSSNYGPLHHKDFPSLLLADQLGLSTCWWEETFNRWIIILRMQWMYGCSYLHFILHYTWDNSVWDVPEMSHS